MSVVPTHPDAADGRLHLDDLHVGQRFTSATHALDAEQIIEFAGRWDPQPFHTDPRAARDSLFGELVASGWHTAGVTMRLLVQGGLPLAGGIVGVAADMAWPSPVRPGDVLTVESEVLAVTPSRSRPDRGLVTVRSETRTEDGRVVQTMTTKVVVPRRR